MSTSGEKYREYTEATAIAPDAGRNKWNLFRVGIVLKRRAYYLQSA
jgi:hypothetical protein